MVVDPPTAVRCRRCANMAQGAKANEKAAKKELEWQLLRADVLQACIKMRYCDGLLWNASTELRCANNATMLAHRGDSQHRSGHGAGC